MADVAVLRADAEGFAPVTEPVEAASLAAMRARLDAGDQGSRVAEVVSALDAGRPQVTTTLIDAVARELGEVDPGAPTRPLVYWAAVEARLHQDDLEQLMGTMDERLGGVRPEDLDLWDQTSQGQAISEAITGRLIPVAGLDLEASLAFTRVYLDNFPLFSRPLGDVDQRAGAWIAQVLDVGSTRATHRRILTRLAGIWHERYPRAAGWLRRWTAGPPPPDPTRDQPWLRALVALARTQV